MTMSEPDTKPDPHGRLARRRLFGPDGIRWRYWLARLRTQQRLGGRLVLRSRIFPPTECAAPNGSAAEN
jgi:hypothetical protein